MKVETYRKQPGAPHEKEEKHQKQEQKAHHLSKTQNIVLSLILTLVLLSYSAARNDGYNNFVGVIYKKEGQTNSLRKDGRTGSEGVSFKVDVEVSSSSSSSSSSTLSSAALNPFSRSNTQNNNGNSNNSEQSENSDLPIVDIQTQEFLGASSHTGWTIDPRCFKNKPLIGYGVGAGEDITWDLAMTHKYGFKMFVFDPTPKSLAYATPIIDEEPNMVLTPEGLAPEEGELTFTAPKNKNFVSMRAGAKTKDASRLVTVKVNSLKNWMKKFNHQYLDVLKIDIEGSEYDVLQQFIDENYFPFTQLLVEYHNRFRGNAPKHQRVLKGLLDAGFVPYHISSNKQEYSYIKVKDLPYCQYGPTYDRKP